MDKSREIGNGYNELTGMLQTKLLVCHVYLLLECHEGGKQILPEH